MKLWLLTSFLCAAACTSYKKVQDISSGKVGINIAVPEDRKEKPENLDVVTDSIKETLVQGPVIMNAIRDDETGEMVATDVIKASKVVARFRNVAERAGYVSIGFDIMVPASMSDSHWQLKISPVMRIQKDTLALEPVYITGKNYRQMQLKGYQRYKAFVESIITDTTDLVWMGQLEIFLERHFPATYSMKTDSTIISDSVAENLFGITVTDAVKHYTKHWKVKQNERKKRNRERMFDRYVRDPIVTEGIRLDTIIAAGSKFMYRYTHTFKSRPALKKVMIGLDAGLYSRGRCLVNLKFPDELTFYISSLSSLADNRPKFRMVIKERVVYDNTKALIDFAVGQAVVDSLIGDNASELRRMKKCIDDVVKRRELELDSLVIVASCSPEGEYGMNKRLSAARSESVRKYFEDYIPDEWKPRLRTSELPENWPQLQLLVSNDTLMEKGAVKKILSVMADVEDRDEAEKSLSAMPQYRYLREKLYPKLRSVTFNFHLHRVGMVKDTVHTSEIDTVYMSGLEALKQLDYKRAVELLRPYGDYNAALALLSADYNHTALDLLDGLGAETPEICYLKAIVLSRLGLMEEALKYLKLCVAYNPQMRHRANLDPEMAGLITKINE